MSFGKSYDIASDLSILEKMVSSFESYLKGGELYGNIGGGFLTGGTSPQLTVGAVVMRLRRLDVLSDELTDEQRSKLADLQARHMEIRNDVAERYLAKVEREANSRLDAMRHFFEECRENRANCPRIYNPEVLRRTVVQELFLAMDAANIASQELDDKAKKTDLMLRSFLEEAEFVWDDKLAPAYPKGVFWWMYMSPPAVK